MSGPTPKAIPPPWLAEPRKLWSLLDMLRCEITDVYDHLLVFDVGVERLNDRPDNPLEVEEADSYCEALQHAYRDCRTQGVLNASLGKSLAMAIGRLKRREYTSKSLAMALYDLKWALIRQLNVIKFALIPEPAVSYFEQEQLFGEAVHKAFPEACTDIKDAGNCIAAELYTAAVFHLMRVSELGLRRLARKLKVKLTHKRKPQPIEYADWEKVISECKRRIDAARATRHGPRRAAALGRYSDTADHCLFMKEIWRNNTAHARRPYNQPEAIAAFVRVHEFMKSAISVLGDR